MRKNITALFLAVVMAVTLLPTAFAAGNGYSDTQGHWGEDAIDRWSGYGVISGTGNGLFDPSAPLTRAQAAQIFANLLNLSATASVAQYTDVAVGSWYYDAIAKCVAAGILNGTGSNTMSPNTYVSREELFVMFARALGIQPQASAGVTFTDSASTASWAAGYVNALADMGVVGGSGDGTLAPKADIDRASVVALLDKAITAYGNTSGATVGSSSGIVLVVADNVTVMGSVETLVVAGGSAGISGSTVGSISVVGESASVSVGGSANVGQVSVTGANASVTVRGEATVSGVTIADTAQGAELTVSGDATVTAVDSAAQNVTISGDGTIEAATVSGDNTTVDTNGTDLTVSEGTTGVTENDKGVSAGDSVVTEPTEDASASDESTTPSRPTNPSRPSYDYYTVTFMLDENTVYDTQRVREGSTVTEPADPTTTQLCKTFGGWYAEGSETTYDFATPVNADLTLVAQWNDSHSFVEEEIRAADNSNTTVATQQVCGVCGKELDIVPNGNAAAQVDSDYYVDVSNALSAADNATVTMLKDAVFTDTCIVTGTVTLDMNGHMIRNTSVIWNQDAGNWSLISVRDNGDLTITGNGILSTLVNDIYAVDVYDDTSRCTIESGTFIGNIHAVYVRNGKLTVNGGHFSVQQKYSQEQPDEFVLNCYDANYKKGTAKITVTGGTFENFDPADCEAEGKGTNFVAEGYTVTSEVISEDTTWHTVVPLTAENSAAEVNGVYYENLTDAIAAADGGTVTMLENAVADPSDLSESWMGKTVTIDLDGNTLEISNTGVSVLVGQVNKDSQEYVTADVTIQNGTVEAYNTTYATANFNIAKDSSLTLDNVDVEATGSVLYPQGDAANVTVRNSTITTSGVYGIATNAATTDNHNVVITVENSTINMNASDGDSCGLMINVAGTMNVSDTTVNGQRQAAIVRAGTASFTNCTLNSDPVKLSWVTESMYTGSWGSGDEVPYGALIVGNQTSNSYLADAIVTLENCDLSVAAVTEDDAFKVFAIYAIRLNNDSYKTEITATGINNITGTVLNYQNTATISGVNESVTDTETSEN